MSCIALDFLEMCLLLLSESGTGEAASMDARLARGAVRAKKITVQSTVRGSNPRIKRKLRKEDILNI